MQITLNFGGFYYSQHSGMIDSAEAVMMEDYKGNMPPDYEYSANYQDLKIEYSKNYIEFINETLNIKLKFVSLNSPTYYNFETDTITAEISKKDTNKLLKFIKENELMDDVNDRIKHITTDRDGYMAYFTYKELMDKTNMDIYLQCVFDVLFGDILSLDNWNDYYDNKCVHDSLYSIFESNYNGDYEMIDELWTKKITA